LLEIKEIDMKKIIVVLLLLTACVYLQAQDNFAWNIRFVRGQSQESVPIAQIIRMTAGETFLITISSEADAFCYIICYDSQRQIFVLSNEVLRAGQERVVGPMRISDPPGTETIYVVMSSQRQTQLEGQIQNFNNNPNSRQHAENLRRDVVSLQNRVSRLGEPSSVYIPSGGTTRGNTQAFVTRFSGNSLYVRAITIRH